MCRYAMGNYKRRYACFACRKSYKRRNPGDVGHHGEDRPARCPQCGLLMADMGRDFRPPRQADDRGWTTAEALFSVGVTFHSCGCSGPGYRPRDPRELQAFFVGVHAEYLATLQQWRASDNTTPEARARAVEFWQGRVAAVAAAMAADG
jgi:DNA-directed RNA polymerase subunit RPC12/RpoP